MNKLYKQNKAKGLAILSMNRGDSAKVAGDYWKKTGIAFPTVLAPDAWHDKYKVSAYPTNYVVGSSGKIIARFVGWDEAAMKKILRSKGIPV
ncbi:MAG: TlpA family protein disulfide reductase [Armatimonadetes bacterium]|nr:TlpA family protein disulfide reductase [Armatimonadota bacterium]